ncbi:MAG: EcsC family protein [Nevskia sp.]|nr:EcsC family protein [Nevskia sp.]
MSRLLRYEREQLQRIRKWRGEPPGPATRAFGQAATPAAEAVEKLVPGVLLRLALESVHAAAVRLSDRRSILRRAQLPDIAALREGQLKRCDDLAEQVRRRAVGLAGGSGAVFGAAGTLGLIADIPTLLTLTFRTIHRIGLCYGEELGAPERRHTAVAVFALASANSMDEKQQALAALDADALDAEVHWREGIERAAERELAKEAAIFSLNNLGRQLARHLGWRKAAESLPVMGAVVGGSVNAWYLNDVARAAQHCFQWRWLLARHGTLPAVAELAAPAPHPD